MITGVIEVGNGEKCPFCDIIVTEKLDFYEHLTAEHQDDLLASLFKKGDNNERAKNKR